MRTNDHETTMNEPWHIELFGSLRARHGDVVITRFATRQTAALRRSLEPETEPPRTKQSAGSNSIVIADRAKMQRNADGVTTDVVAFEAVKKRVRLQ